MYDGQCSRPKRQAIHLPHSPGHEVINIHDDIMCVLSGNMPMYIYIVGMSACCGGQPVMSMYRNCRKMLLCQRVCDYTGSSEAVRPPYMHFPLHSRSLVVIAGIPLGRLSSYSTTGNFPCGKVSHPSAFPDFPMSAPCTLEGSLFVKYTVTVPVRC